MKKIYILLIAVCLGGITKGQNCDAWFSTTNELNSSVRSVYFIDSDTGYIVSLGNILKTNNGGNTWTIQYNSTKHLYSVYFINSNIGFAVGDGVILKTVNSGTNWTTQLYVEGVALNSVYFKNSNLGYVIGGKTILKTIDGGTSWIAQSHPFTWGTLKSVFFTDTVTGYIVGYDGNGYRILKTTDGGINWNIVHTGPNNYKQLISVFFTDSNTGFAVGSKATMLKTTDAGVTWNLINSGLYSNTTLFSIFFTDNNTGYAVGDYGTIIKTTNAGVTWTSQSISSAITYFSVYFTDNQTGYIGGLQNIMKTSDGGLNWNILNDDEGCTTITFPNNKNIGYAGGRSYLNWNSKIRKTTDYGTTWTKLNIKGSISFINSDTGFVYHKSFGTKKTIDGGQTWITKSNTTNIGSKIYFFNNDIGFSIEGGIYKTTDGGSTWLMQASQVTSISYSEKSIFLTDVNTGYVVGGIDPYGHGIIQKTINGGANWSAIACPEFGNLNSVFFLDANHGYCVGSNKFVKTNDAFNTWTTITIPGESLQSVYFTSIDTGYVVGLFGSILKTTNGGTIWKKQKSNNYVGLESVFFINSQIGFTVGSGLNGTVFKTIQGGDEVIDPALVPVGDSNRCMGTGTNTYTINSIKNATSYSWKIFPLNAGIISYIDTIAIVNWDSNFSGTAIIQVCGSNGICNGQSADLNIQVNAIPVINNYTKDICSSMNANLTPVNGVNGIVPTGTSYTWGLPTVTGGITGGVIGDNSSFNINLTNPTNIVQSATYIVVPKSGGACYGMPFTVTAYVKLPPANPDTIMGITTACAYQQGVTYSIPLIPDATSYLWTLPSNTYGSGGNTNTITVSFGNNSGNITVKGINACGEGGSSSKVVTVIPLVGNLSSIIGLDTVCSGQNNVIYNVNPNPTSTSYIWTLPSGAQGTSTTNSISVNYGNSAISGAIKVKGANSCTTGNQSVLNVIVNSLPAASDTIYGPTSICIGQNSVAFSTSPISNSTSYNWTLPVGAIGTSTTNFINVNFGSNAVSGIITVKGSNICGIGDSSILAININTIPSSAAIITGDTNITVGKQNVQYSIPAIANATSYIWTLPVGATGTSSTNSIFLDYGCNALNDNITVCGNNTCGNGNTSSLPVSINSLPSPGVITGNSSVVAGQQNVIYSVSPNINIMSYNWDLPTGASINYYSGAIISINFSQSAVSGNLTISGNNICGDGPSSSLYITVNPFNPNCSAQFDLVADTAVLHHYFVVNNASGVPPLQYNWSWGDGTFSTTAYPTHTYSASGNYKICLTIIDSVGCTTTYCDSSYLQKDPNAIISVQVIPQGTLGISNLLSDKIKIYPNPAKENLIIELIESNISQKTTISIYNIQGQLCRQIISNQPKTEIDIKDLSTGLYFVKLNNEKESFVSRFVKE